MKYTKYFNKVNKSDLIEPDIKEVKSILDSDEEEVLKEMKLYIFIKKYNLLDSNSKVNLLVSLKPEQQDEVRELCKLFDEKRKTDCYKDYKKLSTAYRCDTEKIYNRIKIIKTVADIIHSKKSDYEKLKELTLFFKDSNEFKANYYFLIRSGKNDKRLDHIRVYLDDLDNLYAEYKKIEANGNIEQLMYLNKNREELSLFKEAYRIVTLYVTTESYLESEFFYANNINKDIFNSYVKIVQRLDLNLYNSYLEKKEQNNKMRCFKNIETIKDLAVGINTGTLSDGTNLDLFEFTKRIPFKKSGDFMFVITEFMNRNTQTEYNTIMRYIYANGLNRQNAFEPLNLSNIYSVQTTVNGRMITKDDNDIIISYLRLNDIPLISSNYILARNKYIKGEITKTMVEQKRIELNLQDVSEKKPKRFTLDFNEVK